MTRTRRRVAALAAGLACALLVPAVVLAHPLGNFTINHYAGIRVEADRILLDVVIDQAEIPTFQARLTFDTDGDGEVSDVEAEAGRVAACGLLAPSLTLTAGGAPLELEATDAGLIFPAGVGGLPTMRTVCEYRAGLAAPISAATVITFEDRSFPDRIGWREIVVSGSGVTLAASGKDALRTEGVSNRLTLYPAALLTRSLADKTVELVATPGGATLAPFAAPDAQPLQGVAAATPAASAPGPATTDSAQAAVLPAATDPAPAHAVPATTTSVVTGASTGSAGPAGSIPGGVSSGDLPSIFRTADVTPIVLLVSLLTAAALGAGHALTPGHGKTLMAAYLVGTRGTPLHAAGLGLSVTLSHTVGILILASLVVGAQGFLPPDLVVRAAPVIAAVSILAIGGWMLAGEGRRRWRARAGEAAHRRAHASGLRHEHPHVPAHAHGHGEADGHADGEAHAHDHAHEHAADPDVHGHGEADGHAHAQAPAHAHGHTADPGEHSHGGVRHTHLPPAGSTITWRSLFVLGLAGGLIPSTSALLILLGSIAAGRPAFGFVLVVAFGIGMALVMSGIGLALVLARGRLDRVDAGSAIGRFGSLVPLLASCLVVGLGLYLTVQALSGSPTF